MTAIVHQGHAVRWDDGRYFGIVWSDKDQKTYLASGRDIHRDGDTFLVKNEKVTFEVVDVRGRLVAVRVAGPDSKFLKEKEEKEDKGGKDKVKKEVHQGVVDRWDEKRGFGIIRATGGKTYICVAREVQRDGGEKILQKGEKVAFQLTHDKIKKRSVASCITAPDNSPLPSLASKEQPKAETKLPAGHFKLGADGSIKRIPTQAEKA